MRPGLAHFDSLYTADPDPWNYAGDRGEAFKRRAVAQAVGTRKGGSGVELGCGPGISTAVLANCFAELLALDGAGEAVRLARARLAACRGVTVTQAAMPCPLPPRHFDAGVVSETLYYLPRQDRLAQLSYLRAALKPGGVLVLCHHLARFPDTHIGGSAIAGEAMALFGAPRRTRVGAGWRLDILSVS